MDRFAILPDGMQVMGAGLAFKAGPTLERTRFYVTYDRLRQAEEIVDELLGGGEETEE